MPKTIKELHDLYVENPDFDYGKFIELEQMNKYFDNWSRILKKLEETYYKDFVTVKTDLKKDLEKYNAECWNEHKNMDGMKLNSIVDSNFSDIIFPCKSDLEFGGDSSSPSTPILSTGEVKVEGEKSLSTFTKEQIRKIGLIAIVNLNPEEIKYLSKVLQEISK